MKRLLVLLSATIVTPVWGAPLDQLAAQARSLAAHPDTADAEVGELRRLESQVQVPPTADAAPVDAALKRATDRLDDDLRLGDPTLISADARAVAGEAERLKQTLGE